MNNDIYTLRATMTDVFAWAVNNVRDDIDSEHWIAVRKGFAEIRGALDESAARRDGCNITPGKILEAAGIE